MMENKNEAIDLRLAERERQAAPLQSAPTLPPEEAARANFYGLLARLFYAAAGRRSCSPQLAAARRASRASGELARGMARA